MQKRKEEDIALCAMFSNQKDAIIVLLAIAVSLIWTTTVPGLTTVLAFGTGSILFSS
jgi:hypothetical protein